MATPAHAVAVKSLNQSSGRQRFVFKPFSQRIEDIEIDVYRSLHPLQAEPSEGSCFVRDCLLEWKELNIAEDFSAVSEEITPLVQTLPLVLLHKDLILNKLVSRLIIRARLSLEPILRLIAALSRDLLEDFIPFLPCVMNSLVSLLKNGAEREPDIIEQIFTSWSLILMHLRKYLLRDIIYIFKVTLNLRYYPKDYVQEFMGEAMGFLLRNAPVDQLMKGIEGVMLEVAEKPLSARKAGVSALLWNVMRGTSSRLHSKAANVLQILVSSTMYSTCSQYNQGSETIVEVIASALERLHESLEPSELNLVLRFLHHEVHISIQEGRFLHHRCLLSILVSHIRLSVRCKTFGALFYGSGDEKNNKCSIFALMKMLVKSLTSRLDQNSQEDLTYEVDQVLQLLLCVCEGLHSCGHASDIDGIFEDCSPLFFIKNSRLLHFIKELLLKDFDITDLLSVTIISALDNMLEISEEEVLYLVMCLLQRLCSNSTQPNCLNIITKDKVVKMRDYLRNVLSEWTQRMRWSGQDDSSNQVLSKTNLALIWGSVRCCPHILDISECHSLLKDLIGELDHITSKESGTISGHPKAIWQSLLGATLSSYFQLNVTGNPWPDEKGKLLQLAIRNMSSSQVLLAVSDFLDSSLWSPSNALAAHELFHPDFKDNTVKEDLLEKFSMNLCHDNKSIRVSTLKILCHYEPLNCKLCTGEACLESQYTHVVRLLRSIEESPLSISTSRGIILLISKVEKSLAAEGIPKIHVTLAFYGLLGVLHNRFMHFWIPTTKCLAFIIGKYPGVVIESFLSYLDQCQSSFSAPIYQVNSGHTEPCHTPCDLNDWYNNFRMPTIDSTPCPKVLSLLLQTSQEIPDVVKSRPEKVIYLFLKFLGYNTDDALPPDNGTSDGLRLGSFNPQLCKGKEWKALLKDWLNLLRVMQNLKAFDHSGFLKKVLLHRLLDDNDAETQMKVLECLILWKDDFLLPYSQHLKNIISPKDLREELATWSLSKETDSIDERHRLHLVPIVIQSLIPKVRKLKVHASRKHTSLLHRKAVLNFVAQLEVSELPSFFAALLKPLIFMPTDNHDDANWFWGFPNRPFKENPAFLFLKYFTRDNITALSWKKKSGFLHVIEDIMEVFDKVRIIPFLELLMGCVVRLLEWCTENIDKGKSSEYYPKDRNSMTSIGESGANQTTPTSSVKQCRDLRSLCLKIISLTLSKYQDDVFGCSFWDAFFMSVKPLIDNFKLEGSSSEKPSSLFSCFVAMSKSPKLVAHLYAKKNLVTDIFSILTTKTANEEILSCVMDFIENLLVTASNSNLEDGFAHKMLLSNLEPLVSSLHFYFQGDSGNKRRLHKCPRERELLILKLLGQYIKDCLLARKFVEMLLPVFGKKFLSTETGLLAIQIIRDLTPVIEIQSLPSILDAVSPILISAELGLRVPICELIGHLANADHSLLEVARLLRELNATSVADIGEIDFDRIISAYGKISAGYFNSIRADHAVLILSHFVYDLSSEEIILRHSAYRSLLSFVDFASSVLSQNLTDDGGEVTMTDINNRSWTEEHILRIVNKILINHLGNAMSKPIPGQKEWVELLQHMVHKLPQVPDLLTLKALCDDNAEVDFFNNIVHLQKRMRAKALYRFRDIAGKGHLSMRIISRVFVPMIFNMLFDVQDGKGEHVRGACVDALASVSGQMEWKSYNTLLNRCFREIRSKPDKQKVLLRLVCSILDQFHFFKTDQDKGNDSKRVNGLVSNSVLQKCSSGSFSEIQSSLQKSVLPKLQKLLDSDSTVVNVNISLAALKVLKLLPGDAKDSQLPSIIHRISNFLKNRLESIRDEARSALAACLKELGLEYIPIIISTLQSTLKRGFEMHVLGYTVHFILSSCFVDGTTCGTLDKCLQYLLPIVVNDILGDVAEEKEVDKIAFKMKETRKRKSLETLRLIAGNVTFKRHVMELLAPVTSHLRKHVTPKVKSKLEGMLEQIAGGITCNPSVDQTDLFVFIYSLLEGKQDEDIDQDEHSHSCKETNRSTVRGRRITLSKADPQSQCSHLITVFALRVLYTGVQNEKKNKNGSDLLSMVDPFVKLLANYLNSKYEEVIAESLRCLTQIIMLPLPSLEPQSEGMKTALLDIARSSYNTNSPLMESCLRLLTSLLRHTKITLSTNQLHMLIQFPLFIDLERNPSPLALSLLMAIISRRLVVSEIYDIVIKVAELIVTSQAEDISKKCRQILLEFLLHYDLKEKRLQQHIKFLLRYLKYEHPSGREAVLEMLNAILHKFPKPVLDEWYGEFLIHLTQCMVNDNISSVRKMAGMVLKRLLHCVSPHSRNAIVEFGLRHYIGDANKLWSIGAQVLGLTVEVLNKEEFERHISKIVPAIERFLLSAPTEVAENEPEVNSPSVHSWKAAYYSLVLLEKVLQVFDGLYFSKDLLSIWSATCNLLSNPHIWLRKISCRLLYSYFSAVANSSKKDTGRALDEFVLMNPSRLFVIAASLCCQLKSLAGDDESDNIVKQNLTFAICGLHSMLGLGHGGYSELDGLERFHEAFLLLDPKKGDYNFLRFKSIMDNRNSQADSPDLRHVLISNLIKRMGKDTLEMEAFEMKIILDTFKAISLRFGSNCKEYAYLLLLPLYKICEGHTGKVIPDDVKQLASEVNQTMRDTLGIKLHVEVYNQIRKDLKAKRDKRKQQEKVMAVVDPARNAKRKLKLAAKNKANKKRKITTMKFGRWAH